MTEAEYAAFMENKETRTKVLAAYDTFVKDRLLDVPAASAAQVHDWLILRKRSTRIEPYNQWQGNNSNNLKS